MAPHPDPPPRITLPAAPQKPGRREFPLVATAAPVVGSVIMWAVTGSPFALVFAFLGPVVAVGSLIDSRRQGRRSIRTEAERYQREVSAVLDRVDSAHHGERGALFAGVWHPRALLSGSMRDPEWWRHSWGSPLPVCLGVGVVPSRLAVEPLPIGAPPAAQQSHAKVFAAAATLEDAPIVVDARDGIGIVGPAIPAMALARAVVSQLAFTLSPADSRVAVATGGVFSWVRNLPHPPSRRKACDGRVEFHPVSDSADTRFAHALCVVTDDAGSLPRECRVLIRLDEAGGAAVERNPSGRSVAQFTPWFVSEAQANELAERAAAGAQADGLAGPAGDLPDSVELSALTAPAGDGGRLPATFAVGAAGDLVIDLVRDGPHAVIGGTTGSGKSELLVSWVLALATTCSPAEVNFLLVDFKGGSSFAAVSQLPHTVGLITDLDQSSARRALLSLQAELRHRERVLASAGARSLDELPLDEIRPGERMPRLVILVDEFAVVASEFPDLQGLFADLAGRGRSLGIHLVLCTQRPAGVIRDSVLANCSLRLSLRVNNAADSVAVVGIPDAAALPVSPQGRCLIGVSGAEPIEVQVALASAADADRVAALHGDSGHPVRRPWCEPLPAIVPLEVALEVALAQCGGGLAFGLEDRPASQSQPAAVYDPPRDGNLIVLGGSGSGKTGVLDVLHEVALRQGLRVVRVPADVEGAWDAVVDAVAALEGAGNGGTGSGSGLYLLDDLDAVLARLPAEYQLELVESLARLLREGPSVGIRTVLTAARSTAGLQSLVALCDSRLILRMPSRQEHLLAGGDGVHYEPELPPGAGSWRGYRAQVASLGDAARSGARSPVARLPRARSRRDWNWAAGGFAVVAAGSRTVAAGFGTRLNGSGTADSSGLEVVDIAGQAELAGVLDISAGRPGQVLIGEVGDWQARWGFFNAVRGRIPILFSGCSVTELRSLTGSRQLPPPLGPQPGAGWLLAVDGAITRVQLPEWFGFRHPGR